jgi:hypothetical protein
MELKMLPAIELRALLERLRLVEQVLAFTGLTILLPIPVKALALMVKDGR